MREGAAMGPNFAGHYTIVTWGCGSSCVSAVVVNANTGAVHRLPFSNIGFGGVFNTSLTGYQEIATDPSYAGQIVVLTNPQIGNYGTNRADNESAKPYIEGLIVREFSAISSNWRSEQVTDEYMERYAVPVLAEIDTRALVRHLRTYGVMRGVISTKTDDEAALVQRARNIRKMDGTDLAKVVSTKAVRSEERRVGKECRS